MSTLYIRLPSKSAADSTARWIELACPFALVSSGGSIEREGVAPLSDLSGAAATAQRVVLLLAASDVTLLRVQVPPLSAAKLRAALPNLVEEQLLADPSGCVVVAGGLSGGLRTVAVVQRAWLELLAKTLIAFGARRIAALPAQLCLTCQSGQHGQPGGVTAAINEQGADIDVTLRFSEQDGIGLAIAPALSHPELSNGEGREQHEASAHEVIRTLCAVAPEAPVTLYVPQAALRAYQEAISQIDALNKRINVLADNWPRWIAGARDTALDLMTGLGAGSSPRPNWRAWRWPVGLAAAVLLINAAALNIDWWRMKGEANLLRTTMIQIYKLAYPKDMVILDPVAQMRQKIAIARRDSGLPAPDDFTAISAAFGEAWASVMPGKTVLAIAALEYRERSLFVRFKPNAEAPAQQMKTALAERGLSLDLGSPDLTPAQSAVVWQIRSAK
ncbi:MAG: general secretion pathway protein GspL [Gallionellales bacterium RIFCSPHIGHO2_02_FULL_57_16]|nr:MAG: general secretion pathway protein GspL [Gallionellales bacterium RIFCSPHIGHO2_02_FULL_57_16]